MERFSPGGTSEMSSLLNFQRNLPAANSYRELLDTLRKYDIARMRTEHLNLPGLPPHEVSKSLDGMTKLLEKRNPSLAMRLNLVRTSPEVLVPSDLGITRLMAMLPQEGRRLQAEDEVARNRANQGVQIEQPSASQAVSSKGGKGGSERNPKDIICKFHLSERGCVKGSACEYSHAAPKASKGKGKGKGKGADAKSGKDQRKPTNPPNKPKGAEAKATPKQPAAAAAEAGNNEDSRRVPRPKAETKAKAKAAVALVGAGAKAAAVRSCIMAARQEENNDEDESEPSVVLSHMTDESLLHTSDETFSLPFQMRNKEVLIWIHLVRII